MKHLLRIALSAFALTASVSASADVAVRYQLGNDQSGFKIAMTIEVDESGNARIQIGQSSYYALILGDETYWVIRGPAGPYVARMDDVLAVRSSTNAAIVRNRPPDRQPRQWRFVRIGEEQVGERTGAAFEMGSIAEATSTESSRAMIIPSSRAVSNDASLVVTYDPQLAPVGDIFIRSFRAGGRVFDEMFPGGAPELSRSIQELEQVLRRGAPIKMFAMVLTDVSGADIDPTRFVLPSTPLSVDELTAMTQPLADPPTLSLPMQGGAGP